MSSSFVCKRPLPASSWMSEMEGRLCEGKHDKMSDGGADSDVTHCGMVRRLSLLLSLPIDMRITRDGISELQFSSVAEGI